MLDSDDVDLSKAAAAADGLISSYFKYRSDEVSFYPILDHMALLLQQSLDVSIFEKVGITFKKIYESAARLQGDVEMERLARDPDAAIELRVGPASRAGGLGSTEARIVVFAVRKVLAIRSGGEAEVGSLTAGERRLIRCFFERVQGQAAGVDLFEVFFRRRGAGRAQNPSAFGHRVRAPTAVRRALLDKISLQLNYLYSSIATLTPDRELPLFDRRRFANVFCVVRYVDAETRSRGRYNYSAQLLLSEHQRQLVDSVDSFQSIARAAGIADQPSALLERQIGEGTGSISDSVFGSGFIEFAPEAPGTGRDTPSRTDDNVELGRRRLEVGLLSQFGSRLVHIPIHVGGTPWAIFFIVLPTKLLPHQFRDEDDRWNWFFRFYRTCVPLLADGLRRIVRRIYFEGITDILSEEMSGYFMRTVSLGDCLSRANRRILELSTLFPFSAPEIEKSGRPGSHIPSDLVAPDFAKPVRYISASASDRRGSPLYRVSDEQYVEVLRVLRAKASPDPFGPRLLHDEITVDDGELHDAVLAGLVGAHSQALAHRVVQSDFAGGWAHDVKNATSKVLVGLMSVMRRMEVSPHEKWPELLRDLSGINTQAAIINSVAVSVHSLARKRSFKENLLDLDPMSFRRLREFWSGAFEFLVHAKMFTTLPDKEANYRDLRAVHLAPAADALAQLAAPREGDQGWVSIRRDNADPLPPLRRMAAALGNEDDLGGALSSQQAALALAMLSEVVRNIRVNEPEPNVTENAVAIAYNIERSLTGVVLNLVQVHEEFGDWRPTNKIPVGLLHTLALFGPQGLNVMNIEMGPPLAGFPYELPGRARCCYALKISLNLLKPTRE